MHDITDGETFSCLFSCHYPQVPSPPSAKISDLEAPLEVFNRIWRSDPARSEETWTEEDFRVGTDEYLTDSFKTWNSTVTAYTHCELTLALQLLPLKPKTIELGVSKRCCWPCAVLLELLKNSANVDIIISATHSKAYGGWQFPLAVPDELREALSNALESRTWNRLLEFLSGHAAMRHPSDSQYHSSGESEDSDQDVALGELGVTKV
jgi:hypothetical protein